jgi:hypothetical protein
MNTPRTPDILAEPVRTDADVLDRVATLLDLDGEIGKLRTLWLFFIGPDAQQSNVVVPIDPLPDAPDPELADSVCHLVADVLSGSLPGGQAVITLSRPGPATPAGDDFTWLRALQEGAARHATPVRMLCLATPHGVGELGPAVPV